MKPGLRYRRKQQAKREEILERLSLALDARYFFPAEARDAVGRASGRILITGGEAERYLKNYQLLYRRGEWPSITELDPICYGDHWRQRWWLLRDLVPPTQRVRAIARRLRRLGRRCLVCGAPYPYRRYAFDFIEGVQWPLTKCERILLPRHYAIPFWERNGRQGRWGDTARYRDFYHDWQRYAAAIKDWQGPTWTSEAFTHPSLVGYTCGPACEATRFSRWLGLERYASQLFHKRQGREEREWKWIKQGKELLKEAQKLLNQRACKSQPRESTLASSSPAS